MTAEQALHSTLQDGVRDVQKQKLITFAKYHVQEALKAASENVKLTTKSIYQGSLGNEEGLLYADETEIDKDSILNAYPLTNII